MKTPRRGFTCIELVMVVVILAMIGLLLAPLMKQRWNANGLDGSLNNVRQLLLANEQFRADHAGRPPMRGTGYSNGQITGGWDTWNFAGKNCSNFWQGGPFDEHAYWRGLNSYIQPNPAPVPTGWVNTGSGPTWTFVQGTLTPAQRAAYSVKACRSPGDIATRQRSWPNPTPSISGYDDVGTSYHLNMQWWSQPGGPANFTAKYNAGVEAIRRTPGARWHRPPSNFVWIHDQIAAVVANAQPGFTVLGEFGGNNMSVLGHLDGRAAYRLVTPGSLSGWGYTLGITWP